MQEKIYTIPVNMAFEQFKECPFCILHRDLENNEIELITGASMMSPDVRIKTNQLGFCRHHYDKMYEQKARLSLALTLQTHIAEIKKDISPGGLLSRDATAKSVKRIEELNGSCYVCGRIETHFKKMFETACLLYDKESEFRENFNKQKYFCLPHYSRLLQSGKQVISKRWLDDFIKDSYRVLNDYMTSLYEDVSFFCKKFDYNYRDEPWGTARDSVERAIKFLTSEDA